jgi:hypothetical protein
MQAPSLSCFVIPLHRSSTKPCVPIGARPKAKFGHGWLFPISGQPLLDFDLIEDVVDYAIDLVWESWQLYIPLLDALSVSEADARIVNVTVPDEPSALKALRTFALTMLGNHEGVVRDSNTEQVWTREEIVNNSCSCDWLRYE